MGKNRAAVDAVHGGKLLVMSRLTQTRIDTTHLPTLCTVVLRCLRVVYCRWLIIIYWRGNSCM